MISGTSLFRFKDALVSDLDLRLGNVHYGSPADPMAVQNETGYAVWFSDDTTCILEIPVFGGPDDRWYDEAIECTLILQAIGVDTDDTAATLDERLSYALGQVIDAVSFVTITDDTHVEMLWTRPTGWDYPTGLLGTLRAARFEVHIEVKARIKVDQ